MEAATVSVIVPTLGRWELALQLAQELQRLSPTPSEVILVFQQPDERDAARSHAASLDLAVPIRLELGSERSVTAARNHGARMASGCVLVFIDDDCLPDSATWLRALCRPLEHDRDCVAVTGPVLNWSAASKGLRIGSNAVPVIPLLCHPIGRPDTRSATRATSVWGGNFAVRRREFLEVGGFRQEVFTSPCIYEETELSLRLTSALAGYIAYAPDGAVAHRQAATGGQRAFSPAFSPDFIGRHKRKLIDCVYGRGSSRAGTSVLLNAVIFGSRYVLAGDVSGAKRFVRGLRLAEAEP